MWAAGMCVHKLSGRPKRCTEPTASQHMLPRRLTLCTASQRVAHLVAALAAGRSPAQRPNEAVWLPAALLAARRRLQADGCCLQHQQPLAVLRARVCGWQRQQRASAAPRGRRRARRHCTRALLPRAGRAARPHTTQPRTAMPSARSCSALAQLRQPAAAVAPHLIDAARPARAHSAAASWRILHSVSCVLRWLAHAARLKTLAGG